ncbi:MAG: VWA domain-containing protein, partial [Treponemataceae bacterium]|nr:VWA domain-containing protein [Treponemataceae bacterium]
VLDRSASMLTGSAGRARVAAASEAAAVLLFAAEQNACAVGAVFFDGAIQWACAPKAGRAQVMALFSRLDRLDDGGVRGSALASALNGAGTLLKRRSLVFVLSDFRADGWLQPLARLSGKHDVVAVRVTDSSDTELPAVGTVPFADGETGERRMLPTSSASFQRAWFEDNRQRTDFWQGECLRHGAYPLALSTADDAVQVLSRFFSQRSR